VQSLAKNLKINIKNTQIAEALSLSKIKKKVESSKKKKSKPKKKKAAKKVEVKEEEEVKKPKARLIPSAAEVKRKKELEAKKLAREERAKAKQEKEEKLAQEKLAKKVEKKPEPIVEEKKEVVEKKVEEPPPPTAIEKEKPTEKPAAKEEKPAVKTVEEPKGEIEEDKEKKKGKKKEKKDLKARRFETKRGFDARARQGLRTDEEERWRKVRRHRRFKKTHKTEIEVVRPSKLKVKLPITIKDLASEMKLKASQLISKLFMQGVVVTLNDSLDDETTVQLLGQEFECAITIDTSEEERLRITDKTIQEEIKEADPSQLKLRPPIITFMGHVDHGKTSLIDAIRKSKLTEQEAGAITQHIGAFSVETDSGDTITILDTPGHEAFTEMRSRGATVTDLVVLVIAGDEGIRDQTIEAIGQAKEAKVPILVAINKSDKSGFDPEKVYRQLTDHELLPEAWGGSVITVNCSAVSKDGIKELLEMIALQSEVLELKANPKARARGTTLESEMHKGMGAVATVLVQNGCLKLGDAIVFGTSFGRVKTMHDEYGKEVKEALPSIAVKITGLSRLAEAGDEFIVVANEKEAKKIANDRAEQYKQRQLQLMKKGGLESLVKEEKKTLYVLLRADVQGSLEALEQSLKKIHSKKIDLSIVSSEVGEISESDIQLAAASKAVIIGFHTRIESHAEELIKQLGAKVRLHDIIYHAIDDVKKLMVDELDKLAEEHDIGKAVVKAIFKSSQIGIIAGCEVTEGMIKRSNLIRIVRAGDVIWKGKIASLKRVKDDVKEVSKGVECGIVPERFSDLQIGDVIEAYEITYHEQTL